MEVSEIGEEKGSDIDKEGRSEEGDEEVGSEREEDECMFVGTSNATENANSENDANTGNSARMKPCKGVSFDFVYKEKAVPAAIAYPYARHSVATDKISWTVDSSGKHVELVNACVIIRHLKKFWTRPTWTIRTRTSSSQTQCISLICSTLMVTLKTGRC
jgi:hypothetical protein